MSSFKSSGLRRGLGLLLGVLIICAAARWRQVRAWIGTVIPLDEGRASVPDEDHHVGEHHEHEADHEHGDDVLELSATALKNLGLAPEYLRPLTLQTYRRSLQIPGVVVDRPGRTQLYVTTPMTGVVTHVHAVEGEAVSVGSLLFEIRLTHEDLVDLQTEYLKALGEIDVELREISRLQSAADIGAIAGKTLLERRYAKEKLDAILAAQREALRLHGLSQRQVDQIAAERTLLRDLQVVAPSPDEHAPDEELHLTTRPLEEAPAVERTAPGAPDAKSAALLVIDRLNVQKGQSVAAGERLCLLSDDSRLFIEGRAFEQDAGALTEAAIRGWPVAAELTDGRTITELPLVYIASDIDPESRTLRFYVDLHNAIVRDKWNAEGQRFVSWRYRPGQRARLRVPVEEWADQFVLPAEAVAQDGLESIVFRRDVDGDFRAVSVHVRYRDQTSVVVDRDSLAAGDVVALRGAHQMLNALRNSASDGAVLHDHHH